ncbi:uncharacterized protein LTHEOB_7500 [Neofusicoccum parvum]|uniref:Uncharacterized protein LTHEOB_7500 n=1 Tax=Neofusicoccum parvum TaxID=310453 RepID=A0ACB5S847_9PEZI|nr:uncharacterized protein LTHEOB_7500 [Neofusicoccum parvum]
MPKKYQQNYKPASNYVHPSLSSSRTSASSDAAPPSSQTVNDRLNQLRREQAPISAIDRRNEITESLTTRVVHPAVRQLLNLPEISGPRPRFVQRTANGRRVPGPAAPQSWLNRSRHAPEYARDGSAEGSLVHYACKALAKNWDWLLEYEQYYLATLPTQLKDVLFSYLAMYGPEDGISLDTLRILFLTEQELEGATGSDELIHLDLTGMITEKFTLRDLTKYMIEVPGAKKEDVTTAMQQLSVSDEVADSWEEADSEPIPTVPKALLNARFPNLTHLSLAHPQNASWEKLLILSSHLATLTHLSLAFWPKPTMTPNAAAASMTSKHGRFNLGGTHFYSEMDDDWQEAANILRRLANNTYCLKWLDLTGCDWTPALTWGTDEETWQPVGITRRHSTDNEDWLIKRAAPCPDWNGSWRQVTYINVSQGWIPHNINAIRALPARILSFDLLNFLKSEQGKMLSESQASKAPQTSAQVNSWIEKESQNRTIAQVIKGLRNGAKGQYCRVDYGWSGVDSG